MRSPKNLARFALAALALVVGALVVGMAVACSLFADEPKADVRAKVDQLVAQLGDSDSDKQAAAAASLLKLGPDILPLLPADEKLTDSQKKQLKEIRDTLRDAQAQKELAPKLFTSKGKATRLSQALADLATQTGNPVEDRRRNKDQDLKLNLDLNRVSFWQALDEIALRADLRVSLFERDAKIALVDGPHQALPISYQGLFRVAVKRLMAIRDLEADRHSWIIFLEIAWEPRFQPLFLDTQPTALEICDGQGLALKELPGGSGRAAVSRPLAIDTQVRVEAPRKPTERISLLKGTLTMFGPSRMLTFSFDNLAPIDRSKPRQTRKETQDGVTVHVREFATEPQRWSVNILLEYPAEGPEFESFESWLVNNQLVLEKKTGKERLPANGGYEIDEQVWPRAVLSYRFIEEGNLILGRPADWKLVYRTPGTIVKVPVRFEFKDLPVP
jgi:hypothetical protein